jgi:dihydropyrimidine dehydrogenase (NAD+) subunit PreA
MHHGFRIVEDMIEGLSDYLDSAGFASVSHFRGRAVPAFKEWGELDLNYQVRARIDPETCIGCHLCYVACMDGAHQCIHVPGRTEAEARAAGHAHVPRDVPERRVKAKDGFPDRWVPFVDEDECIGCNLCALVCPVPGCITMVENQAGKPETWDDRVRKGTDWVPGGLDATARARDAKRPG